MFSQSSTASDLLDRQRFPAAYRTVTFCGRPFQSVRLRSHRRMARGHGLIRFRSPLLTESRLISFPPGTEMFQFPGFAPHGLCIQPRVTPAGCPVASGCPIRTSPDQNVFGRSPELIAAYRVLHRLCVPRHPPYTLNDLTTFMNSCDQDVPVSTERERSPRRPAPAGSTAGYRLVFPASIPVTPTYELVKQRSAISRQFPARARSRRPQPPANSQARGHPQVPRGLRPPPLEPTGIEPATSALQTRRSPD